jgi:putative acetyltransferase
MRNFPVRLERALAPNPEIFELIGALDAELGANYTPEQRHAVSLDALFKPPVKFFVAWSEEGAQGCGGVALFSEFAELKRMYVRDAARGTGIADALLARLTAEAAEAGLKLLRLETGNAQLRALRFYERNGFSYCGAFPPYDAMAPSAIATSLFMEKRI